MCLFTQRHKVVRALVTIHYGIIQCCGMHSHFAEGSPGFGFLLYIHQDVDQFESIRLNAGSFQNVRHLHLKVWMSGRGLRIKPLFTDLSAAAFV